MVWNTTDGEKFHQEMAYRILSKQDIDHAPREYKFFFAEQIRAIEDQVPSLLSYEDDHPMVEKEFFYDGYRGRWDVVYPDRYPLTVVDWKLTSRFDDLARVAHRPFKSLLKAKRARVVELAKQMGFYVLGARELARTLPLQWYRKDCSVMFVFVGVGHRSRVSVTGRIFSERQIDNLARLWP